jgi:23S rRNA (cytidine1920-2'-O)/16S rRNA (cytidine1409-2'-O)-methyltransferase
MTNLNVMDIGSSTGGFSDCALKHGASSIIAVDVGTDLMHESLRNHSRIDLHEKTNFKEFHSKYFKNIDMAVCDVSFISLKRIIDKISSENVKIDMVCLIKPQFECGKEIADKYKGIILNKQVHIDIIKDMINYFNEKGFYIKNLTSSPIRGGDGNIEYLTYISNKIDTNKNINIEELVYSTFKNR